MLVVPTGQATYVLRMSAPHHEEYSMQGQRSSHVLPYFPVHVFRSAQPIMRP